MLSDSMTRWVKDEFGTYDGAGRCRSFRRTSPGHMKVWVTRLERPSLFGLPLWRFNQESIDHWRIDSEADARRHKSKDPKSIPRSNADSLFRSPAQMGRGRWRSNWAPIRSVVKVTLRLRLNSM
jgi:hypothetical protein